MQSELNQFFSRRLLASAPNGVVSVALIVQLKAEAEAEIGDLDDTQFADELIKILVQMAQGYAVAPTSVFKVGAVAHGNSGSLYLGANLEVINQALAFSVHAEQSAINNAFLAGESGIRKLTVSAAPCGHCRQFLYELNNSTEVEIEILGKGRIALIDLLPQAFAPLELGVKETLFSHKTFNLQTNFQRKDQAADLALELANNSYAPYTQSPSGFCLAAEGELAGGTYIESAAYNPSLPPILSAIDRLRFQGCSYNSIESATLVEGKGAKISQQSYSEAVLKTIAPQVKLTTLSID